MKKFLPLFIALCYAAIVGPAFGKGPVHVRAYVRKDGTPVSAHTRSAPTRGYYSSTSPTYGTTTTDRPYKPQEKPFSVAPAGPTQYVPTYDPTRDPNWVPAKIVNGQYIQGHFRNDPDYIAADTPRNIPWRPDPPARRYSVKSYRSVLRKWSAPRLPQYRFPLTQAEQRAWYRTNLDAPLPTPVAAAQPSTGQPERDANGRIKRSESAKQEFMRITGYPNGRPGYVVDHIVPLKRGGADDPSNMQWQTIEEAKAKDKWE